MKNRLLSATLAGIMALSVAAFPTQMQTATRDKIAAIKLSKSGKFNYWTKDSEEKQQLINYVKYVTNKSSQNFIPIEDRIAVFDVDGTLACETAPFCFDFMMFIHRALDNPNYTAAAQNRENAEAVKSAIYNHKMTNDVRLKHCQSNASVFSGMTPDEYADYTKHYFNTRLRVSQI